MTTIMDIAKLAKVSRTTVSRVLNENGYVSEEARKRVLKAVEQTGYIPSSHAKSLRTKKSSAVGVILPKISTETASRVVSGIDSELAKQNYQVLLANTQLNPKKEIEYIKLLQGRQVDAIILLATNVNESLLQAIHRLTIPFISLGQDLPDVTSVVYDDYHAAADLTELLIEKGHNKIAFIGVDEEDYAVGYLRKKGFLDTMQKYGLKVDENWLQTGDFSIESGFHSMKRICEGKQATATFSVTDRMAIGAMQYLKEAGIGIPEKMAMVGIGNSDMSQYVTPSLTTVDYFNEDAGKRTARLILDKLKHKGSGDKKTKLNYGIIERDSL